MTGKELNMRRLLLIGKGGQLGWELQRTLATLGEVTALDYPEIDLAKPESLREVIRKVSPQILVNAAAYTNVDKAESEPELAQKVNAEAPGVMAEEAKRLGAVFIHYSTDYVFDGKKKTAYVETDFPNPLNVYGKTKLEGEQKVQEVGGSFLIIRTSWMYSLRQGDFVTKVREWARKQTTLRIVDDQVGSPTWARMLAEATAQVIAQGRNDPAGYIKEKAGLYHLAGGGSCSRYEWAKAILDFDLNANEHVYKRVVRASLFDFPTIAKRPSNSSLECLRVMNAFSLFIMPWKEWLKLSINSQK
jgi:dTDP-4-dehydrorhamnose reductase